MTWTNEKPTKSGYYWYRDFHGCRIVEYAPLAYGAEIQHDVWFAGSEVPKDRDDLDGQWAGPVDLMAGMLDQMARLREENDKLEKEVERLKKEKDNA